MPQKIITHTNTSYALEGGPEFLTKEEAIVARITAIFSPLAHYKHIDIVPIKATDLFFANHAELAELIEMLKGEEP